MKALSKVIFMGILGTFPLTSMGQPQDGELAKLIETVTAAKALDRIPPKYPKVAAIKGQEGWVKLSFIVSPDGKVEEPIIEESSGVIQFEKAALRAVKKWRYSPAMRDGESIEQCQNSVQMDFMLDGGGEGVRRSFSIMYSNVTEAIADKNWTEAEVALDKLRHKSLHNRYENAWYWMIDTVIAKHKGDKQRIVASAGKAIHSSVDIRYLGDENFINMAHTKFFTEIELQNYGAAYQTYLSLTDKDEDELSDYIQSITPTAQRLSELLNSDEVLVRSSSLQSDTITSFTLHRNSFSLIDVQGKVGTVDIRCKNQRSKYAFAEQSQWVIPASWGQCRVFVTGTPQTSFTLVEGTAS